MSFPLLRHPILRPALVASVFLLGIASCESDQGSRRGSPRGGAGGAPVAPAPDMEAHGSFFAGQIEAEVVLGRAGFEARDAARGEARGANGGEGRGRGGFSMGGGGSGRRGGGAGRRSGGEGGGMPASSGAAQRNDDGTPPIHLVASNLPPVRLHLRLTNHGTEPVEVEIPDFNSDLGNFVVQPAKLVLPPNQPTEADPMTSRLGVKAEEIALTVAIRAHGRVEKQVLALRIVPPTAPAPPAAASSPATVPPAP